MKPFFRLTVSICYTVFSLSAASIVIQGSDSETGLFDTVSYTVATIGNSSINQAAFTPASGQSTLSTTIDVTYQNYLSQLPVGASITGATLDLAGLFSGQAVSSSLTGGTQFYQPAFGSGLGAYKVTITSTLANTTLSGSSAVGYNLWPIFQNDILAGHAIMIAWSAPDTFTANTSTYTNNCKNCTETFSVKDTANFVASSTSNDLTLNIVTTPEPGTLSLAGIILAGLSIASIKNRRRSSR